MAAYKRIFLIVMDSLGIGPMEDAAEYGDAGADTLGHIVEKVPGIQMPNLIRLGIANIRPLPGIVPAEEPIGCYGRLREMSNGKDTMTGHWEMMGLRTVKPFQTFTENGFPDELIQELEKRFGRPIVGNKSSSGTVILEEYGEEEDKGAVIVYTSADSVLQICGNEETMGVAKLYEYCEIARELTMKEEWKVGRVIARPYVKRPDGTYERTANRHDYALKPFGKTVLNSLSEAGYDVISVGKIYDIFVGEGVTESNKSKSSVHGMEQTIEIAGRDFEGLCFTNLVDFDSEWGHRRNPVGYAEEIERFDVKLGELMPLLKEDDLLIITADHGNDPTYRGTDHTREKVPFLAWSPSMTAGREMEEQDTFAVIGAFIARNFGVEMPEGTIGTPILNKKDILSKTDHTLLKQNATWEQIRMICEEGMAHGTASVCIPPSFVKRAKEYTGDRLAICTVIGFPNGYMTTAAKVFETEDAVKNGADEIDMVINIGDVKDGEYGKVLDEIKAIKTACHGKLLKVIIETCLLTEEEKKKMCEVVTESGADFIKTSTGFSTAGATFADVELMAKYVGKNVKIKAAGGISTTEDAVKFLELGASRLGTSRLIQLLEKGDADAAY